jgi:hypothetical protein
MMPPLSAPQPTWKQELKQEEAAPKPETSAAPKPETSAAPKPETSAAPEPETRAAPAPAPPDGGPEGEQ